MIVFSNRSFLTVRQFILDCSVSRDDWQRLVGERRNDFSWIASCALLVTGGIEDDSSGRSISSQQRVPIDHVYAGIMRSTIQSRHHSEWSAHCSEHYRDVSERSVSVVSLNFVWSASVCRLASICEKLKDANFHENIKAFLQQEVEQPEIINNLLQLIHLIKKQSNIRLSTIHGLRCSF